MADFNPGTGDAGGTVNTGAKHSVSYTTTLGLALASGGVGTTTQELWTFDTVDNLKGLPRLLWDQGNMEESLGLIKLAKAAGYSSWDAAMAGAANDPLKSERGFREFLQAQAERVKALGIDLDGSGGGGGDGPFSYTTTSRTISDESSAAALADKVWQEELGRMASDDEIRAFQKALNAYEQANPSVNTQAGVVSGNNRTASSTTTGGFDPTRFATEYARSRPDYAEHFAGVQFMSLLDRAISTPNALDDLIGGGS